MICSICGEYFDGYGNNPYPVRTDEEARCCDECDNSIVLSARIALLNADYERIERIAENLNECSYDRLKYLFNLS